VAPVVAPVVVPVVAPLVPPVVVPVVLPVVVPGAVVDPPPRVPSVNITGALATPLGCLTTITG